MGVTSGALNIAPYIYCREERTVRSYQRRISVELGQVAPLLWAMAARPSDFMDGTLHVGACGAAALRFRERVRRCLNTGCRVQCSMARFCPPT